MIPPAATSGTARFGPYEVYVRLGEVRKFGIRIKLGEQPLRILILLLERQGEMVTREELRKELWPEHIFVDFEHSLNSAVQRLREGLSDTAGKSQWIETVPRRGYRFVQPVEWIESRNGDTAAKSQPRSAEKIAADVTPAPLTAEVESRGRRGWRVALMVGLLLLLAIGVLLKVRQRESTAKYAHPIRSLAVIPLENLSGDPTQEYLADGMTDELITALARNHSLLIISRTSVMRYKGIRRPVRDIARELGVDAILEGSVSRNANRVHMTVQLIDASSDTHVWANSYDRDFSEVFGLPSELSQTIAREVKAAISTPAPERYINPAAHDLYLRGRYFFFSANDAPGREYLEKAIQIQPDYAAAWSGLADYYGGRSVTGQDPPQQLRANWEADARKGVELDDSLAEAHNSMAGWYFLGEWDCKRAEAESLRTIALNPNFAEGYHLYGYILMVEGRGTEAVEAQKRAVELDPMTRRWSLGYAYYQLRQFDAAINELRLREQGDSKDLPTHFDLAAAYRAAGFGKEAVDELRQMYLVLQDKESADAIHQAFEHGGERAAYEWLLEHDKTHARGKYSSPFWMAFRSAQAKHQEETLRLLEDAYREHSPRLIFLQNEPAFDFLRSELRFQDLVRKVGLPVAR